MHWAKLGQIFAPEREFLWMRSHAAVPFTHHLGGELYRIYFSCRDERNRSHVGGVVLDFSSVRPKILDLDSSPALAPGGCGSFDEDGAMACNIVEFRDELRMYYIGWNLGRTVPFRNSIGLAVSRDNGATFEKLAGPVLDRSLYHPFFVASPFARYDQGQWRLWFLSCTRWERKGETFIHHYNLHQTTSENGIDWRPQSRVCIDFLDEHEYAISRPCVLRDADCWRMWYSHRASATAPTYRIGYATSDDGENWTRRDNEAGIDVGDIGWDADMVCYPYVFDHQDRRYLLYNGNGYGLTGFGLAVLE